MRSSITANIKNETGAYFRASGPGKQNGNGQINFPKVISVSPAKVQRSQIETAWIKVLVEIDATGPVWLGFGCVIACAYKTDDPEWYLEKHVGLATDNLYVKEDSGIRTIEV